MNAIPTTLTSTSNDQASEVSVETKKGGRPITEVGPLRIGDLVVDPPILQAPMAGFTNFAFRQVVRDYVASVFMRRKWSTPAVLFGSMNTMRTSGTIVGSAR